MRSFASAIVTLFLIASPAVAADKGADVMKACAGAWKAMPPADQGKTTYKAYSAECMRNGGPKTATIAASGAPAGATGRCKDGSWTTTKSHAGACSGHGGVEKWL